jgi:hypothetical protein
MITTPTYQAKRDCLLTYLYANNMIALANSKIMEISKLKHPPNIIPPH